MVEVVHTIMAVVLAVVVQVDIDLLLLVKIQAVGHLLKLY